MRRVQAGANKGRWTSIKRAQIEEHRKKSENTHFHALARSGLLTQQTDNEQAQEEALVMEEVPEQPDWERPDLVQKNEATTMLASIMPPMITAHEQHKTRGRPEGMEEVTPIQSKIVESIDQVLRAKGQIAREERTRETPQGARQQSEIQAEEGWRVQKEKTEMMERAEKKNR